MLFTFLGLMAAHVALLPLDSRPATSDLPAHIANLSGNTVRVPALKLLGNAQRGANFERLVIWLEQQTDAPLFIALDTLAYGGLVQSRTSSLTFEEACKRLSVIKAWHERTKQEVYAFITLPREPDATNRERNLAVVREMILWAKQGVFKELHVTWDDAQARSPALAEGEALRAVASENVFIYPGADEVLANLLAKKLGYGSARLVVEYSDPQKAEQDIPYEGIPLIKSVEEHAQAIGWEIVPTRAVKAKTPFGSPATEPLGPYDLYLYVYNGGHPRAVALRIVQLMRQGRVAIADVASVNKGTVPLWEDLNTLKRLPQLSALAAWGTPGNNVGTALAHGKMVLGNYEAEQQDELLAREFANDIIFSTYIRPELRKKIPEDQMNSPEIPALLIELSEPHFPLFFKQTYVLEKAELPWQRSFEWSFQLKKE